MNDNRQDVIMAGIGGKGVLVAAQILAKAALGQYTAVSWTPTYYALMRAGACECTVVMTNGHLGSPVLSRARVVVVFEASQVAAFQNRVAPGGVLLVESAGLPEVTKTDVRVLRVPAIDIAVGLGDIMAANFVLLGAYLAVSKAVSKELIEAELEKRFGQRQKVLDLNLRGLNEGRALVNAMPEIAPSGRGT